MKNYLNIVKIKDRVIYLFLFDILIYYVIIFYMTKGDIMAKNGITWFDLFDTPEKRMIFAKSAADQMMVQMKEENITIHTWCKAKKEEFTNEDILLNDRLFLYHHILRYISA